MTLECTTSTLPAIGTPLAVPVPANAVAVGAVRTFHRARRGARRFRRAAVIVTCVTVASGSTTAGVRYLPPLFGGRDAPPARIALVGGSAYGDYAAPNPSAMGPSHLPQVVGWAGGDDGLVVGFVPPAGGAGGGAAITAPGPSPVSEPGTLALIGAGILSWFGLSRRKRAATPDTPEVGEARRQLAEEEAIWAEEVKVVGADKMPVSAQAYAERTASLRAIINGDQVKDQAASSELRDDQTW